MRIFRQKGLQLENLRELPFSSEKEIQRIIEKNLDKIFGLEFVSSEMTIEDFRIDTLAFDRETQSFVIIEYKKGETFSVIDQGYTYLSLLLNRKAHFILEYTEKLQKPLSKQDIDWSQSRVIFISPRFTKFQRNAINFRDLPIELWEVNKFEEGLLLFNQIEPSKKSESIKTLSQRKNLKKEIENLKTYTEEDLLENVPADLLSIYEELKSRILQIDPAIRVKPRKHYISFVGRRNIIDIKPQRSQLRIWLNLKKGELKDPYNLAEDVSKKGHLGNGDYEIKVTPDSDVDYLIFLIKQSYQKNK